MEGGEISSISRAVDFLLSDSPLLYEMYWIRKVFRDSGYAKGGPWGAQLY